MATGGLTLRALFDEVGAFDRAFLSAIASRRFPRWLDAGFRTVTHLGGVTSTCTLGTVFLAAPPTRRLGLTLTAAHLVSHSLVQLVKRTVNRNRPTRAWGAPAPLIAAPDAYSFPSGHACAALTTALVFALADPRLGLPMLLVALAIGFSRIYLRVHYATDVLVGQVIGAIGAIAGSAILPVWR